MNVHKNARLTPRGRERIARQVASGQKLKAGSDIWKRIEPPCSFANLIDALAADYGTSRAIIAAHVQTLLGCMAEQDVVRLS
jgi:hypothetical protein